MKPSWNDAPKWANWLAMDGDGLWVWFELEPEFYWKKYEWLLNASEDDSQYEYVKGIPDESGIDWDYAFDTLEQRPATTPERREG